MIGRIDSIKLCYTDSGVYWLITLVDQNNNIIGTFGDSSKDDAINFRMQTFGIMKILNNMNMFGFGEQKIEIPALKKGSFTRVESIANFDGEYFLIDQDANMSFGKTDDLSEYEPVIVASFESKSGVLSLELKQKYTVQYFQIPEVYLGFNLVYDASVDKEREFYGANKFMFAVCNIMKVCNISDLLMCGSKNLLVSYALDGSGKISAICNLEQTCWLNSEEDKYTLSDMLSNEKSIARR